MPVHLAGHPIYICEPVIILESITEIKRWKYDWRAFRYLRVQKRNICACTTEVLGKVGRSIFEWPRTCLVLSRLCL